MKEELDVTVGPTNGVPEAVALIVIPRPASMSSWVVVYVAEQVVVAPDVKLVARQDINDKEAKPLKLSLILRP